MEHREGSRLTEGHEGHKDRISTEKGKVVGFGNYGSQALIKDENTPVASRGLSGARGRVAAGWRLERREALK